MFQNIALVQTPSAMKLTLQSWATHSLSANSTPRVCCEGKVAQRGIVYVTV